MDDLTRLGDLLKLPNLDEDTVSLINSKMREMIQQTTVLSNEQQEMLRKNLVNVMDEWMNGEKKAGDPVG